MADIQTTSWSETASSNSSAPPDGAPEGMAYSAVNDTLREIMGALKREWNRSHPTIATGGTATALTLTYTTAPAAYVQGLTFSARITTTSGANPTLNVNLLGARKLYVPGASGPAIMPAGALVAGGIATFCYDTTLDANNGGFLCVTPTPVLGATTVAGALTASSTTALNGAVTLAGNVSQTPTAMGAGTAIDLTTGNWFSRTISGATTFTITGAPTGATGFILELTNGGSAAITWPASVRWPAGAAPTLTSAGVDVLVFLSRDGGTTWRGTVCQRDSR